MTLNSDWYQVFEPRPAARARLYCLPCAGGGASMFRPWADHVPDWVELRAVKLPGRQARHREASFDNCDVAAHAIAEWFSAEDMPYALFGHSMGAMLAYRAIRLLHAAGAALPVLLAAASWPVAGAQSDVMPHPDDSDEVFCAKVGTLGGPGAGLLDEPGVRELALPVLRADFRLCRSYSYRVEDPLPVPVAVFGGDEDPVTPADSLSSWKEQAERLLGPRLFTGGHFFLHEWVEELATEVVGDLAMLLAERSTE